MIRSRTSCEMQPNRISMRQIINEPMFRITSMKKMFFEAYGIFGLGIVIGLAIGYAIGAR